MTYLDIGAFLATFAGGYLAGRYDLIHTRKKKPVRFVDIGQQHGNATFITKKPDIEKDKLDWHEKVDAPLHSVNTIADHLEAKDTIREIRRIHSFNEENPTVEPINHPRKKHRKPRHSNRKRS